MMTSHMGFGIEGQPQPVEAWTAAEAETEAPGAPTVPESEMEITFARSSGPGGQNVNKTSTKALVRWSVGRSRAFSDGQKAAIRAAAGNRLTADDEILVAEQAERSQLQNRESAVARLRELVAEALAPKAERRPTRVSRSEKRRRLEDKRRQGEKKQSRRSSSGEW